MKLKYFLAAMAASAMLFSACDKDENDPIDDEGDPSSISKIDSVWYEVTNRGVFTPAEYGDSLVRVFAGLEKYKAMMTMGLPAEAKINTYSFNYMSKDEKGADVKLSGLLVVPTVNGKIVKENLVIDNRATQTGDDYLPSKKLNLGEMLALLGNPIVTSDLLGYGASKDHAMNYCCYHLSARNTVDAAIAAQFMLSSEAFGSLISDPLPVYNLGYSQGGYDALAVQRYMEVEATDKEKELVNIQKSYCGAGPYELRVFQNDVMQRPAFMYSPYMLISNLSIVAYHPELMGNFKITDVLTEKAINSGILQMLDSRKLENTTLIGWNYQQNGALIADFFTEDMRNKDSELFKTVVNALAAESLAEGWKPKGDIYFFHGNNDDCVPVGCTKAVEEAFKGLDNCKFEYDDTPYTEPGLHQTLAASFYFKFVIGGGKWF